MVLAEQPHHLVDQLRRRLVAGADQLLQDAEQLRFGQRPGGAVVAIHRQLGLHERREDVVTRLVPSQLELLMHEVLELEHASLCLEPPRIRHVGADRRGGVVRPPLDVGTALLGEVEHVGDDLHRHRRGQGVLQVDTALIDEAVDRRVDDRLDVTAELSDPARVESAGDRVAVAGVLGRIGREQRRDPWPALLADRLELRSKVGFRSFGRCAELRGERRRIA